MFPSVRVKVKGLEPLQQYYIAIDVVPVDSKRYRYGYRYGHKYGGTGGTPTPTRDPSCADGRDLRTEQDTRVTQGSWGPARTCRIYRCGGRWGRAPGG